jgi:hypothetical protein
MSDDEIYQQNIDNSDPIEIDWNTWWGQLIMILLIITCTIIFFCVMMLYVIV